MRTPRHLLLAGLVLAMPVLAGCDSNVGKGAAIGAPYLFGALIDWSGDTVWSLTFVALVMLAGGLLTLLGKETRGAPLA